MDSSSDCALRRSLCVAGSATSSRHRHGRGQASGHNEAHLASRSHSPADGALSSPNMQGARRALGALARSELRVGSSFAVSSVQLLQQSSNVVGPACGESLFGASPGLPFGALGQGIISRGFAAKAAPLKVGRGHFSAPVDLLAADTRLYLLQCRLQLIAVHTLADVQARHAGSASQNNNEQRGPL